MTPTDVPPAVEELITSLPKVELHVHLEGSMQPDLLLELADEHGVPGVPATLEGLRRWYEFRDFEHFITVDETVVTTLRDEDDFARPVEQAAAGLAEQNVHYAEVIFTPRIHMRRGVAADTILAGVELRRDQHQDHAARRDRPRRARPDAVSRAAA